MAAPPIFVDTWGWASLACRNDPRHCEVKEIYRKHLARGALICTSDYVLDEVATLLFGREAFDEAARFIEAVLRSAERGPVSVEQVTPARFRAAWVLRLRFRDKPRISFTDLTSIVMMKELGLQRILTGDSHFVQVGLGLEVVPGISP